MDLQELYNRGYRRFKFSDGEVREPCEVKPGEHSQKLRFNVGNRIWYYNDGTDNLHRGYPHVVGVAEDESVGSKRDEIRRAIESAVNRSCNVDDETYENIVDNAMIELDGLVERWTDEETAEDIGNKDGMYTGQRVRMSFDVHGWPPAGTEGTVVIADGDYLPGVLWDEPHRDVYCRHGPRTNECGSNYQYAKTDKIELIQ